MPSFPSFPRENWNSRNVWKTPGSPRHPSSRHPRPSEFRAGNLSWGDSAAFLVRKGPLGKIVNYYAIVFFLAHQIT